MSKSPQDERDGYAVDVSLLKFRPAVLALSAACLTILVSLLGWFGSAGSGQLAAPKAARNHAANRDFQERRAAPNAATNQDVRPERADDRPAASEPAKDGRASDPAATAVEKILVFNEARPAAAPTPSAPAEGGSSSGFTVQAGSFNTISEANERVNSVRAAGFEARVAAVELEKRGTWYRVYSGRFTSREEAGRHDKKLRASGIASGTIIVPFKD